MSTTSLLYQLNLYSPAIQAISTVVLVIVTIVYAIYTAKMARVMNRQVSSDVKVTNIVLGTQLIESWVKQRMPLSSDNHFQFKVLFDVRNHSSGNGSIDKPALILKFPDSGFTHQIEPKTKEYEQRRIDSSTSTYDVTDMGQTIFLQGGGAARPEIEYGMGLGKPELVENINKYIDKVEYYLSFSDNLGKEYQLKIENIKPHHDVERR